MVIVLRIGQEKMTNFLPLRNNVIDKSSLVERYLWKGFQYSESMDFMSNLHNTNMSFRSLHRILRARDLRRRRRSINMQDIMAEIMDGIRSNGSDKGYRAIHQALTRKGFAVDKDSVRFALKDLDPEGVALRSRHKLRRRKYYAKRPNDIWHLDGNDKLKPHGFSIHGCIDGFSRKMLWLKLSPSNKNPSEIAYYYINTVLKVGGVPRRMKADRAVENATVASIQ